MITVRNKCAVCEAVIIYDVPAADERARAIRSKAMKDCFDLSETCRTLHKRTLVAVQRLKRGKGRLGEGISHYFH